MNSIFGRKEAHKGAYSLMVYRKLITGAMNAAMAMSMVKTEPRSMVLMAI